MFLIHVLMENKARPKGKKNVTKVIVRKICE